MHVRGRSSLFVSKVFQFRFAIVQVTLPPCVHPAVSRCPAFVEVELFCVFCNLNSPGLQSCGGKRPAGEGVRGDCGGSAER